MSRLLSVSQRLDSWEQPWRIVIEESDDDEFTFLEDTDEIYYFHPKKPREEISRWFKANWPGKQSYYFGYAAVDSEKWIAKFFVPTEEIATWFLLRWGDRIK